MSAPDFLHCLDAMREELGQRVMRALGDEHSQLARKFVTRRAYDAEFGAVLDHEATA